MRANCCPGYILGLRDASEGVTADYAFALSETFDAQASICLRIGLDSLVDFAALVEVGGS